MHSTPLHKIVRMVILSLLLLLLLTPDVQAGLVNRKIGYTTWKWEEEVIVLTLDYFQLPFTILVREMSSRNFLENFSLTKNLKRFLKDKFLIYFYSGLGVSLLCFLVEILMGRFLSK